MIDYGAFYDSVKDGPLAAWGQTLPDQIGQKLSAKYHGDVPKWFDALRQLPNLPPASVAINDGVVSLVSEAITPNDKNEIETLLHRLHPWRKGPFNLFGIHIDSEWRSDMKWDRLRDHLQPLKYRSILDVGSGNGYFCWRMLEAGAKRVIGIDPTLLSVIQFYAIRRFTGEPPVHVLPLGIEDVPKKLHAFDTVFSMGVLYHRRSPVDHLYELLDCLRPGGELVLETLIVEGGLGYSLMPEKRYGKMRNVWFIPSCLTLEAWMRRCGYRNIRLIDVSKTTNQEQRKTEWMRFQSLDDFLHADDSALTCEGLPAPRRAVFIANSPK